MAAWLDTWKYRHKITIDSSKIDTSNLTHFPVTVFLNSSAGSGDDDVTDIFDELGSDSNRKKIAFTKADGTTQLFGEIEKWDNANEKAVIHVSRSGWEIDYDSDTEFYIYFDSSQSDNTDYIGDTDSETAENVWDSNFKAVWHLADATTSTTKDSTSNDNDGTKLSAGNPAEIDAKIGKGQDFSTDYIAISETDINADLNGAGAITMSAWIKLDSTPASYSKIIAVSIVSNGIAYSGFQIYVNSSDLICAGGRSVDTEDFESNSGSAITHGIWYYVTGILDFANDYIYIYLNDGLDSSKSVTFDNTSYTDSGTHTKTGRIGNDAADENNPLYWDGIIDELRVSNIKRNANWIKASYNSGNDTLIKDYGDRESFMVDNAILFSCNF